MGRAKNTRISPRETIIALVLNSKGHFDQFNILIPLSKCTIGHFWLLLFYKFWLMLQLSFLILYFSLFKSQFLFLQPFFLEAEEMFLPRYIWNLINPFWNKIKSWVETKIFIQHLFFLYGFRNEITILRLRRFRQICVLFQLLTQYTQYRFLADSSSAHSLYDGVTAVALFSAHSPRSLWEIISIPVTSTIICLLSLGSLRK